MKISFPTLVAMTAVCLSCAAPAFAQQADARPNMTITNAERQAVELKQGMSLEEVEKLLGKPKRTALRQSSVGALAAPQGSLQWSYMWSGAGQRDDALQVVFTRRATGEWLVESWAWNSSY